VIFCVDLCRHRNYAEGLRYRFWLAWWHRGSSSCGWCWRRH